MPRIAAVAIAEHDTASAMIATGGKPGEAFLSLGTWGLLGAIVEQPIVTEAAFRANVANEGGVGGTWRFLRNIMGLWLLEQCRAAWSKRGLQFDHVEMVRLTDDATPLRAFIDPDDPRLIDPPDLPEAIGALTGLDPNDTGAILRCITDSLAMKSRYVLESIETAAGIALSRTACARRRLEKRPPLPGDGQRAGPAGAGWSRRGNRDRQFARADAGGGRDRLDRRGGGTGCRQPRDPAVRSGRHRTIGRQRTSVIATSSDWQVRHE